VELLPESNSPTSKKGGLSLSSVFGKESRSTFLQRVAPKPRYLDLTLLKV